MLHVGARTSQQQQSPYLSNPKKKVERKPVFFFFIIIILFIFKSAATGRTRIRTLRAVERKSEVNRTELEFARHVSKS